MPVFRVVGWKGISEAASFRTEQWRDLFGVYVDADPPSDHTDVPPILGSYRIEEGVLVFQPRFPLQPGLRYRAVFHPAGRGAVEAKFEMPKRETISATGVERVYPSTNLLPENQLKFYLHFSAPMSRGEAYRRIHLLDERRKRIDLPFLELQEELWDHEGKRLTIFFDPGRIKRGLLPHEEVGAPIEEGKKYTLVIDRGWLDAEANPLEAGYEKSFSVGPPDREPPDPRTWQITVPKGGTLEPLIVEFPEPMDAALLHRLLEVVHPRGNLLHGSMEVDRQETRWQFQPGKLWKPGDYFLRVETILEDLAGNTINRAFEVDVFERVEERVARDTVRLRFTVPEGTTKKSGI